MCPILIWFSNLHHLSYSFEAYSACWPWFLSVESPFGFELISTFVSIDMSFLIMYILYTLSGLHLAHESPDGQIVPCGQLWIHHISPSIALIFFLGIFSNILGLFSPLPLQPLWAATDEIPASLWPLDHHIHVPLKLNYRPKPSYGTSAAVIAANSAILTDGP